MSYEERLSAYGPKELSPNDRHVGASEWLQFHFRNLRERAENLLPYVEFINTALINTGMDVSMKPDTIVPVLFPDNAPSIVLGNGPTRLHAQVILEDYFHTRRYPTEQCAHRITYELEHPRITDAQRNTPLSVERVALTAAENPDGRIHSMYRFCGGHGLSDGKDAYIVVREKQSVTGNTVTSVSLAVQTDGTVATGIAHSFDEMITYDISYRSLETDTYLTNDIMSWDVSDTVPLLQKDDKTTSFAVSERLLQALHCQLYVNRIHMLVPGRYLGGDVSRDDIDSYILRNADRHIMNLLSLSASTIHRAQLYHRYILPHRKNPAITGALSDSSAEWFRNQYRDLAHATDIVFTSPAELQDRIPISRLDFDKYFYILGHEKRFWEETESNTDILMTCAENDPGSFWKYLQETALIRELPVFRELTERQIQKLTDSLAQFGSSETTENGLAFFCRHLIQTAPRLQKYMTGSLESFARTLFHPLPDLYRYYDRTTPDGENQSPEYYMTITLALAYYSLAIGWEPFGALIVKNGKMIGAHNELIEGKRYRHAEENALNHAEYAFNDPELTGCDMYTTEPCPRCAITAREHNLRNVYISTPTNMGGESVFGKILTTDILTVQDYYPPPTVIWNILRDKFIRLYRDMAMWKKFVRDGSA